MYEFDMAVTFKHILYFINLLVLDRLGCLKLNLCSIEQCLKKKCIFQAILKFKMIFFYTFSQGKKRKKEKNILPK